MIARRIQVSGRVQGVWYRAKTKEQADQLGVKGWVRNRPDGRVEAHLEGEEENVDRLIAWMQVGPTLARVDELDEAATELENLTSFEIKRYG
jgi:acylphosphatase